MNEKKTIHGMDYALCKCSSLHLTCPEKAKPFVRMGQKATDLMKNHKMAGLPKGIKCFLFGKPAFFKPVFLLPIAGQ